MSKIPQDIYNQIISIPGCIGIVFTGSRQDGTYTEDSDWDFYVLLDIGFKSYRKTWKHEHTFIEVFCNTIESINTNELVTNKISNPAIRMLATGEVVFDSLGQMSEVQMRARKLYDDGPLALDEIKIMSISYFLRNIADDLKSLDKLKMNGHYLQKSALVYIVESFYRLNRRWIPKPREVERDILEFDPDWYRIYEKANSETGKTCVESTIELINKLAENHRLNLDGEITQYRE